MANKMTKAEFKEDIISKLTHIFGVTPEEATYEQYYKAIAIMYSGDAAYVLSENENMAWYEPEQGTNKWVDAMVIPANASCTGLAHAWINEMISEEVQYENSEYVGYTSVNAEVVKKLSSEEGAYFEDPAYTPRTNGAKDEVFHYNPELKRELSDRWNKVKVN